jgi:hypothetical protein
MHIEPEPRDLVAQESAMVATKNSPRSPISALPSGEIENHRKAADFKYSNQYYLD